MARLKLFKFNPGIISIHVPKTAGSSFHKILKNQYGFRLKHLYKNEEFRLWNNGKYYKSEKPSVKAVHGHIQAHPKWKEQYPKGKLIAWVRDPVARLVSAYHH